MRHQQSQAALPLPSTCDVAIVGAGAAGLATAILLRRLTTTPRVVLLDSARNPGAKILVSGGSRCNVTNVSVRETDFWTAGRRTVIRQVLRAFSVPDTIAWFHEMGVVLHEEADGKLFPDSNRARDVLLALLNEAAATGVELCSDARVLDVAREAEGFTVRTGRGTLQARTAVLATGGRSLPKSGSDGAGYAMARQLGHTIVETTTALAPLMLAARDGQSPLHARLTGVAQPVELTLWTAGAIAERFRGSMLWTHFGVSGPVALNASRHWERATLLGQPVRVTINLCPGWTFDRMDTRLTETGVTRTRVTIASALAQMLPASVAQALPSAVGLDPARVLAQLTREERRRLARSLVEYELTVSGTRGFTYAEATAGGVDLAEIDAKSMASRVCPGLFLVGEILDVDGRLGGYNFQWAWSSAKVAARGLAASFKVSGD